jgi:beta-lactamase class A
MLEILAAQEVTDDVVRGVPPGTRVAHKNGWVEGIRHSSAIIYPSDAPPYVQVVLVSAPIDNETACDLIARITGVIWMDRHRLSASEDAQFTDGA